MKSWKYVLLVVSLLFLLSCKSLFNWTNDTDEDNPLPVKTITLAGNLSAPDTTVLTWNDDFANEAGFLVIRSVDDVNHYQQIARLKNNVTSYTDKVPDVEKKYYYKIIAYNYNTIRITSSEYLAAKPEVPSFISCAPLSVTQMKLTWSDVTNESGYVLERKTNESGAWTTLDTLSANTVQFIDNFPATRDIYYYRLKANSVWGNTDFSATVNKDFTPSVPTNLVLEHISATTVKLTWTDNCSWEQGYKIDRKVDNGNWQIGYATTTASFYTDNNAIISSTIIYRVYAHHKDLVSNNVENEINIEFAVPTNLVLQQMSPTSVKLTWTDNCLWEQGYKIDRKVGTGAWQIGYATATTNTFNDNSVTLGIQVQYAVYAYYDSSYSTSVMSSVTPTFPAPTNLVLQQMSATSVKLTWTDNCTWEQGYKIDRKIGTGSWQIAYQAVGASSTTYVDYDLTVGVQYTYRVYAYDSYINTACTNEQMLVIAPLEFIFVQGGTFNNGTSNVMVSSFYVDKYEITQSSYLSVMGTNPSYFTAVTNGPVETVSWFKAVEYCNKRSTTEGLTPCYTYNGYGTNPANWPESWDTTNSSHTNLFCNWSANGYRLLTEAEWQFVARGGNLSNSYTYSGSLYLNIVAWYSVNSQDSIHSVGTKTPNELGIYDMSGNVWEWCWDIYGNYPSGSQNNPHGINNGLYRVSRGGSWHNDDIYCTVSYRNYNYATYCSSYIGFRVCRALGR